MFIESWTVKVDLGTWEESQHSSRGVWYDGMVLCQIFQTKSPCLVLSLGIQKCIRENDIWKVFVILGQPQDQHTNQVMFQCSIYHGPGWRRWSLAWATAGQKSPCIFSKHPNHHLTALSKPDQKKTGSSSWGFQSSSHRNLGLEVFCLLFGGLDRG